MNRLAIYCADIGSVAAGRFGWSGKTESSGDGHWRSGTEIQQLVIEVSSSLRMGVPVALGLECPLFVPVPDNPRSLTSARPGEGARPWCAGAGAGALATGLTETVWILREVRAQAGVDVPAFVDWKEFTRAGRGLFLWEAFVSGSAKATTHCGDAELAVRQFDSSRADLEHANAIHCEEAHSLIGAALLRTGWSTEIEVLRQPCIVIKV